MNSTPKSLLTDSTRRSEAKGSSESSFAVSEIRSPRIMPAVIVQGSSVKPHLVETKAKTKCSPPFAQHELGQPTVGDTTSTPGTDAIPSKIGNVTLMRPRYSRRVQSRSEPVSASPVSEPADRNLPPAKPADDTIEQRRVSAPISQAISSGSGTSNSSAAPSLIPKPGNKGLPAVRQLPIPPRNSSDGKCGLYSTPAPRDSPERRLERLSAVTKAVRDATPVPATGTPTRNENQAPQKTAENRPTATSSRPGRSIRRMRAGAERARRGRASQGPAPPSSS